MFFTSAEFLTFFICAWLFWRWLPRGREVILLVASLFFLSSFGWASAAVCAAMGIINFLAGPFANERRRYLFTQSLNILSISLSGLIAGSSKFFDIGELSSFWLVAGLSFYNLQHYAYLYDIRQGRIAAETDLVRYLLASAYFPRVLSGPITLYQQIGPQLARNGDAQPRYASGFQRILLGFFKKLVIADGLAPSVSSVFDHNAVLPGITVLGGAILFTIQLYFDFSGYCDMAIGFSRLFGISLPENFLFPFRSRSFADFWRRWHVTLFGFLTQYVFLPVTFRLRRFQRHGSAAGILAVFVLSALWHGAGLTFLLWGITHAVYMLIHHYTRSRFVLPPVIASAIVVSLFSFSNVFFRSPDLSSCFERLGMIFAGSFSPVEWDVDFLAPLAVGGHQADVFNFLTVLVIGLIFLAWERRIFSWVEQDRFRWMLSYVFLMLIFLFGVFGDTQRFIYMQF